MLLALFLSIFLYPGNEASPILEQTNPPPPSTLAIYTPTRSIFAIVWACITTTFLCAWVSVHPNILPQLGEGWERVGQKVRLLLVTVIMPELVVGWAWKERLAARKTKREFSEKDFKISMAHAHLIEMGGFALCLPEEKLREASIPANESHEGVPGTDNIQELPTNENEKPPEISAVDDELTTVGNEVVALRYVETLSARRLRDLLVKSAVKFPKITNCELQDRSKTDGLAKLITGIQVLWFVIQCIVRGAMGLAVTELELTTLALASLNLYTLWSWRDKPQNVGVQVPVYLLEGSGEWDETFERKKKELGTLRSLREAERQRKEREKELSIGQKCLVSLGQGLKAWQPFQKGFMAIGETEDTQGQQEESEEEHIKPTNEGVSSRVTHQVDTLINGLPSFLVSRGTTETSLVTAKELPTAPLCRLVSYFSQKVQATREWWFKVSFRSWKGWAFFIWDVLLLMLIRLPFWIIDRIPTNVPFLISIPLLFLLVKSRHICHFFDGYLKQGRRPLVQKDVFEYGMQAALVGTVFGGLHLVGWNFAFPTTAERWLWRSMSLVLTIIPYFAAGSAISLVILARGGPLAPRMTVSYPHLLVAAFFLYVVARLCILVLALSLLRNQPATAYLAVKWTKLLPHASS